MSSHNKASAYADQILRQLGMHDSYTVNKGDAELVWDLAYDAFMWRSTAGTLAMASPPKPALAEVQTDYADEDDGTVFMGGRL